MSVALPCPKCGPERSRVKTDDDGNPYDTGFLIYCDNCYDVDCVRDPPTFVTNSLQGHGRTLGEAIQEWNYLVEEYEPTQPLAGNERKEP